jgi:hypothetical protein
MIYFSSVRSENDEIHCASRLRAQIALTVGEWLSLVEHLVRDQGVGGSNPLSPTNLFNQLDVISGFSVTLL